MHTRLSYHYIRYIAILLVACGLGFWVVWSGGLGSFTPQCPEKHGDPLGLRRVDCYPEGSPTEYACLLRGCCWDPDTSPQLKGRVPSCFFPSNHGYRMGEGGVLERVNTPSVYGAEWRRVKVEVEQQTDRRLRLKLSHADEPRAEVPFIKIQGEGATSPLYDITIQEDPFSILVTRKSTGTIILETVPEGLVLSDQFLQITLRLASHHLYGLGEHLHTKLKHDMDWRTWVIHASGKHPTGPEAKNMYGSHPVYMNIEDDGNANMVLLLNQHAMDVVLQPTPAVTFRTIGGVLDLYVFLGEWGDPLPPPPPTGHWTQEQQRAGGGVSEAEYCSKGDAACPPPPPHPPPAQREDTPPVQAIQQYIQAVGLPVMPPYWALGFHLCRWEYGGQDALRDVINRNRRAEIPYDVQWGDVDYQDTAQTFTIDQVHFPDLPAIVRDLHEHGQRYVAIHDPGFRVEPRGQSALYDDGTDSGVWVRRADGGLLIGESWPGAIVYADFTSPQTVAWWTRHAKRFHDRLGHDGFWTDMNEPTSFVHGSADGCEINRWNNPPYTPKVTGDLLYNRTLCMDSRQVAGRHYDIHSLYGHSMANATYSAARTIFGDERSLIVTRSSFVGSGQFAGKWLGDNMSRWRELKWSIIGMIEMNMFGFPYVGADICGFFRKSSAHLCERWMQLGAFYPFSRNHNKRYNRAQDPASWKPAVVKSMRAALMTRYRLLPYLYTQFHRSHTEGTPVVSALAFEFPLDGVALSVDQQFLWGRDLLVSPVLKKEADEVKAYFPKGRWYDLFTGVAVVDSPAWHVIQAPHDTIPLHVRGGSVLPLQQPAVTTTISRKQPFSLIVALDDNLQAEGKLFWDDGTKFDSHISKECRVVYFRATKVAVRH